MTNEELEQLKAEFFAKGGKVKVYPMGKPRGHFELSLLNKIKEENKEPLAQRAKRKTRKK